MREPMVCAIGICAVFVHSKKMLGCFNPNLGYIFKLHFTQCLSLSTFDPKLG